MKELDKFIESQQNLEDMNEEELAQVASVLCQRVQEAGIPQSPIQDLFIILYDILLNPVAKDELRQLLQEKSISRWEHRYGELSVLNFNHF